MERHDIKLDMQANSKVAFVFDTVRERWSFRRFEKPVMVKTPAGEEMAVQLAVHTVLEPQKSPQGWVLTQVSFQDWWTPDTDSPAIMVDLAWRWAPDAG